MRLFWKFIGMHFRAQTQYRASFLLTIGGQFLTAFSALVAVYFLMDRFHAIGGFSLSEILLCFAIILMAFSLAECFVRGFDRFPSVLANGGFDRILVRPRGAMLQVLCSQIEFSRLGRLVQAVLVFCYAIPASPVVWTADKIALLILMIASGVAVFSGLFVIRAALCFYTTEGLEFMNIFTDGSREFGAYPFGIFGETLLRFYTYVVPIALVQYYPLLYLTGRSTSLWHFAAPAIAFVFLVPCRLIWSIGIRHYRSTGS